MSEVAASPPESKFKKFALSQDFASAVKVTNVLTKVRVGRPHKQEWWRIHPGEDYRMLMGLIDFKEDDAMYGVDPALLGQLGEIVEPYIVYTAINRQDVISLLPIRIAGMDGKDHDAWSSLRMAAGRAMEKWVNVRWHKHGGTYELTISDAYTNEPDWKGKTFDELMEIAFADRFIESLDHPVIKKLLGIG